MCHKKIETFNNYSYNNDNIRDFVLENGMENNIMKQYNNYVIHSIVRSRRKMNERNVKRVLWNKNGGVHKQIN